MVDPCYMADFHQIVVYDWDDTLCCSTHLHGRGYDLDSKRPYPEPLETQLNELDDMGVSVLSLTVEIVGAENVLIVTNAEDGWVEMSGELFLPKVHQYVKSVNIRIISARSMYEKMYPQQPGQWKHHCFRNVLQQSQRVASPSSTFYNWWRSLLEKSDPLADTRSNGDEKAPESQESSDCSSEPTLTCIVSFGDSQAERTACQHIAKLRQNTIFKTVKFLERPDIEQLYFQLSTLRENLVPILHHKSQLDKMVVIAKSFDDDNRVITA